MVMTETGEANGARKRRLKRRRISAPTNFTAIATSESNVTLTWTLSTGPHAGGQYVDGYKLLRDGVEIRHIELPIFPPHLASSYEDSSLSTQTSYTYELYAYNRFGGQSPSATVTVTTLADHE